jgi:hypothetical protein
VSARAIYKHWKRSLAPAATDPNAPPRQSPYEKLKGQKDALVKHNIELKRQLEAREDGDRFKPTDTADDIATTLVGMFSVSKASDIAKRMLDKLKTRKAKKTKSKTEPPTQPPAEAPETLVSK